MLDVGTLSARERFFVRRQGEMDKLREFFEKSPGFSGHRRHIYN